jgi:hypothetical protein
MRLSAVSWGRLEVALRTAQKTNAVLFPAVKKTGLALVYASILCVIGCVLLWYILLNNVAVDRKVSLVPGTTITQKFSVNYSGFYRLGIRAQRKLPHPELQCLLGINDAYGVKDCKETRLKYLWTLNCDRGKVTYSGNSDKIFGGAYASDWVEVEFGGFEAKHWQRCTLQMKITDASPLLSSTNPKLYIFTELF